MESTLKYKTLKEVQAAYISGELSRNHQLSVDYEEVCLYDLETDALLFSGKTTEVLQQALLFLGMPSCEPTFDEDIY